MMKSSAEIRTAFLEFFAQRGHARVPTSPLIPASDPTLLFTNAGMVQFKDLFLGLEQRGYQRAVSVQRCVRAGGKHNDLENVGYTARHHTFFEMLGNFSFGDYFKRDAIQFAWEFLTQILAIPSDRLWVTVYAEDEEAAQIWLNEIGADPSRFSRIGDKPGRRYDSDNFWSMGDTGPCGPCTEIFYDHGSAIAGGPPGSPEEDGDRYIEIWNLVFMQYNRDKSGNLTPLPKPSVDTGMGLERLAAVLQGVHSNYDTDIFQHLLDAITPLADHADRHNPSFKVIADHIRSCAFLITDGVIPSNEGRGYVLRRIIRRAIRHGHKLAIPGPFFYRLVAPLVAIMGTAYPELVAAQSQVERALRQEEERFAETLEQGMALLEQAIGQMQGNVIAGETIFRLYDTYGFPVDLTGDIARERGLSLDMAGFDHEMAAQRERARAASQFDGHQALTLHDSSQTEFNGYHHLQHTARITALYREGSSVSQLGEGDKGIVVLDTTPFYGESGGQAGDAGTLTSLAGRFEVRDTQKQQGVHLHYGIVASGELHLGDQITASVDANLRQTTACHHSATHLLHAALRQILGNHVQQKGSLVTAHRLRFDFAHFEAPSRDQLQAIEQLVNHHIRANHSVDTAVMAINEARALGAMALFGEKYGETVRVLRMSDFSIELCGGTHVSHTGEIGLLKIMSEGGVAAGVRRIEAVVGADALAHIAHQEAQLSAAADLLKAGRDQVVEKLQATLDRVRKLEREIEQFRGRLASSQGNDLAAQAITIGDLRLLAARIEGVEPKALREMVDQLKSKLGQAAILLATVSEGKVSLIAGVTANATHLIKAGDLLKFVAEQVGGKGGGRADLAQGGGSDPGRLDEAIAAVSGWVTAQISGGR
jgi:alanyl-tRNA synthetase